MNEFEKFINETPRIQRKIDYLADPIIEFVDEAIASWTSQKRDKILELTPERRELLIRVAKIALRYQDISESPFYQFVRAYEFHLYYWLLNLQKEEVSQALRRRVEYLEIFDEIVAEAFRLGYATRMVEPKPPKKKRRG